MKVFITISSFLLAASVWGMEKFDSCDRLKSRIEIQCSLTLKPIECSDIKACMQVRNTCIKNGNPTRLIKGKDSSRAKELCNQYNTCTDKINNRIEKDPCLYRWNDNTKLCHVNTRGFLASDDHCPGRINGIVRHLASGFAANSDSEFNCQSQLAHYQRGVKTCTGLLADYSRRHKSYQKGHEMWCPDPTPLIKTYTPKACVWEKQFNTNLDDANFIIGDKEKDGVRVGKEKREGGDGGEGSGSGQKSGKSE